MLILFYENKEDMTLSRSVVNLSVSLIGIITQKVKDYFHKVLGRCINIGTRKTDRVSMFSTP